MQLISCCSRACFSIAASDSLAVRTLVPSFLLVSFVCSQDCGFGDKYQGLQPPTWVPWFDIEPPPTAPLASMSHRDGHFANDACISLGAVSSYSSTPKLLL
mmetsp:Transcript_14123/g.43163  ORF Transcript_14123/g.43163 Transcript_14123/m.43163 type:complete len:101 (-) Transcript_14123:18-320(-)|eukprot:scaffold269996_cov35-Tisochrysis_lutea.AAC.1